MQELKKVFNAARALQGDSLEVVAGKLGVSRKFLSDFLNGDATSAPLEKKIRAYISKAGLEKSIKRIKETA
jgi:transcriptional regulator with XRE-family HTH domain